MYTIYHNPHCGASREALKILHEKGGTVRIVEYLTSCPSKFELSELIQKLGIEAHELVRKQEPVYKEQYEGKSLSSKEWIDAMVKNPVLIDRPIIVRDGKAVLGTSREAVEKILEQAV